MKQKRLGKKIAAWMMCLTMVITMLSLPMFTKEVKAADSEVDYDAIRNVLAEAIDQGLLQVDLSQFKISADKDNTITQMLEELKFDGYIGTLGSAGTGIRYRNGFVSSVELSYDKEFLYPNKTVNVDAMQFATTIYNQQKEALYAGMDESMSDVEKVLYVHNWLIKNVSYGGVIVRGDETESCYTPKGGLVNGNLKCSGYSITFKMFMDEMGIECLRYSSNVMNHEWNAVKLNGKWYMLDLTWDDNNKGAVYYAYFLKSDDEYQLKKGFAPANHHGWDYAWGEEIQPCTDSNSFEGYIFRKYGTTTGLINSYLFQYNMEYYNGYWYFSDGQTIKRAKIDGSDESILYTSEDNLKNLYLNDGYFYFMGDKNVYRFPVSQVSTSINPTLYINVEEEFADINISDIRYFDLERNVISLVNSSQKVVATKPIKNDYVAFENSEITMNPGESITLSVNGSAKSYSFKSFDSSIVSVDENGKITAKKGGTVQIMVYTKTHRDICTVHVLSKLGDLDADGDMDQDDLKMMLLYIAGNSVYPVDDSTDINDDGKVDIADYVELAKLLNGVPDENPPETSDVAFALATDVKQALGKNEEFQVYLDLKKNSGISGLFAAMHYDVNAVSLEKVEYGDFTLGKSLFYPDRTQDVLALEEPFYQYQTYNHFTKGDIKFFAGTNEVKASTGRFLILTFMVNEDTDATSTSISFTDTAGYDGTKNVSIGDNTLTFVIDASKVVHKHASSDGFKSMVKEVGATCTEAGYMLFQEKCATCGKFFGPSNTLPMGGALGHTGGKATCVSKAGCTRCGEEYGEIEPENHDFIDSETKENDTTKEICSLCHIKNIAYEHYNITAIDEVYDGTEKTAVITGILDSEYDITGNKQTEMGTYEITLTGKNGYAGTKVILWTIVKEKPTYTVPEGLTATCGSTLSTVALPEGFVWTDDLDAKLEADSSASSSKVTRIAKFVPTDKVNYSEVPNISIEITVTHSLEVASNGNNTHSEKCKNADCTYKTASEACTAGKATCTTKATLTTNGKLETKCTVCNNVLKTEAVYAAKTVMLDKVVYTYDGKTKKPSVIIKDSKGNLISTSNYTVTYPTASKKVGEYTVKVTFKGNYKGSKSLTFKINPVKTAIASLTAGSKSFTVKWAKKTAEVTGYQIQYSTSDKFKTGNKTVTITKNGIVKKQIKSLKAGKKYFVRVRTYKTVGKVKFYSEWSAKKAVTTKK